ncbi:MAG: hypothetical protein IJ038_07485 [Clostridia bacterium]|nr:hypothetical protein [Clostridia bacterium]
MKIEFFVFILRGRSFYGGGAFCKKLLPLTPSAKNLNILGLFFVFCLAFYKKQSKNLKSNPMFKVFEEG